MKPMTHHKLFDRFPYKSFIAGAQYDPFSLLLHIDDSDPNYSLNNTHETIHWYQHHGTTIGAFLSAIRYSQNRTTLNLFRNLPKDRRQKLCKMRETGRAIIETDENGQLIHHEFQNTDIGVFRQIWYDHQLIAALFDDPRSQESIGYPVEQIFGEICGDIILFTTDHIKLSYPGNDVARAWFRPSNSTPFQITVDGNSFGTRDIIESMAIANNYLSFDHDITARVNSKFGGATLEKVEELLTSKSSGIAMNLFLSIVRNRPENFSQLIPTFNTACDLALNPPIPPIVMRPPNHKDTWEWKDLYPPLRFVQICHAINELHCLGNEPDHDEIEMLIRDICSHLIWECPLDYLHPYNQRLQDNRFTKEYQVEELEDKEYGYLYDYVLWVQHKMWHARKNALPVFINRGMLSSGYLSRKYIDYVLSINEDERWRRPPIMMRGSQLGHNEKDSSFGTVLLLHSMVENALFDFMINTGDFDLLLYPSSVTIKPEFTQFIYKSVSNLLMVEIDYKGIRFEHGQLFISNELQYIIKCGDISTHDIDEIVAKHVRGNYGDLKDGVEKQNESSIATSTGNVYSVHQIMGVEIHIVTTLGLEEILTIITTSK